MMKKNHQTWLIAMLTFAGVATVAFANFHQQPNQETAICQTFQQPFAYTICQYHPKSQQQLHLVWQNPKEKTPFLTFDNIKKYFHQQKQSLNFAMNAGMYDDKYAPIGYTVINGKQIRSLNLKQGAGNFHLMPNGVFWWDKNGFFITESQKMSDLLKQGKQPVFATQSGPMLVINGDIHPKFDPNSTSFKFRNGVGVCHDGQVKFVISDVPVNFYQFADLFKTQLGCQNALFLDGGTASAIYSRELKRQDDKFVAVTLTMSQKNP